MQIDPALRMLGLAAKAGKVASGEFMTEGQTKSGRASRQHEEEVSQHV
mgnify:CR=1 FL=1